MAERSPAEKVQPIIDSLVSAAAKARAADPSPAPSAAGPAEVRERAKQIIEGWWCSCIVTSPQHKSEMIAAAVNALAAGGLLAASSAPPREGLTADERLEGEVVIDGSEVEIVTAALVEFIETEEAAAGDYRVQQRDDDADLLQARADAAQALFDRLVAIPSPDSPSPTEGDE